MEDATKMYCHVEVSAYSNNRCDTKVHDLMEKKVTGLILAGGKGSRMETKNKGLTDFRGKPLIQHVIERLEQQVDEIIISANDELALYQSYGYQVIPDSGESLGPLSGILSSASLSQNNVIFITACDMPFLPRDIVEQLSKQLRDTETSQAIVPIVNGKIEPLASLVNLQAIGQIKSVMGEGIRSVSRWLTLCDLKPIVLADTHEQAFMNINTLTELHQAETAPKSCRD